MQGSWVGPTTKMQRTDAPEHAPCLCAVVCGLVVCKLVVGTSINLSRRLAGDCGTAGG